MLQSYFKYSLLEAGTDEAGRGCLAGPVVAAAVILPSPISDILKREGATIIEKVGFDLKSQSEFELLIKDSKQLSEKTRFKLQPMIEKIAVSFAFSFQEPEIIDEINILNASLKAMRESILDLKVTPIYIVADGNRPLTSFSSSDENGNRSGMFNGIPYSCIIKGDSKFMNIAAASVLAKNYRDAYMNEIHDEFPMYNWKKNKGYATKEHREAIRKYGATKYHRKSFRWLPELTNQEVLGHFNKF